MTGGAFPDGPRQREATQSAEIDQEHRSASSSSRSSTAASFDRGQLGLARPSWPSASFYSQDVTSELPPLEITALNSSRLLLEQLAVEHSDEMAPVLDDPLLHTYIGGEPLSAEDLRVQYARQAVGRSKDGAERWLNWIVRLRDDDQAVGYIQATVTVEDGHSCADVAWVIGSQYQRRGFAKEAAQLMVDWLRSQGVRTVTAHVHPDHRASEAVARQLGLHPTAHVVDGEIRWEDGPLPAVGR